MGFPPYPYLTGWTECWLDYPLNTAGQHILIFDSMDNLPRGLCQGPFWTIAFLLTRASVRASVLVGPGWTCFLAGDPNSPQSVISPQQEANRGDVFFCFLLDRVCLRVVCAVCNGLALGPSRKPEGGCFNNWPLCRGTRRLALELQTSYVYAHT